MADAKISGLTDGGLVDGDDELAVARSGASYKARPVGADGWVSDSDETWTYASATSFTVSGDLTAKYTVGTRIKLTQTTVKYFVIVADPTYSSPNTTVTISGGSDYTLANSVISAKCHSYAANPQGYPGYFTISSLSPTGFSGTPTENCLFSIIGRTCHLHYRVIGTSNATTKGFTLPVAYRNPASGSTQWIAFTGWGQDSGTSLHGSPRVYFDVGSTTVTVNNYQGSAWTASGTCTIVVDFQYTI